MGIFDGCLIACDVDGTLMDNGYINPRVSEKIKYFLSEGGKFSLATGRSRFALSDVFKSVDSISPSVLTNGTVIYDFKKKKNLLFTGLSKNDYAIPEIVKEKFPGVGIEIHGENDVYTVSENDETLLHEEYESIKCKRIDIKTAKSYNWSKVLYLFNSHDEVEAAMHFLNSLDADSCFIRSSAIIKAKRRYYCEQVPNGVSKATALLKLCEMLGVKKGGFFAIGDYYNDIEMLSEADISACPEHSPEDVKAAATVVFSRVEDGAVADFIDYLKDKLYSERK